MNTHFVFSRLLCSAMVVVATPTILCASAWAGNQLAVSQVVWDEKSPARHLSSDYCRPMEMREEEAMIWAAKKLPSTSLGSFSARCISVIDGDTLVVKHNGAHMVIRLNAIDAPELSQKYGPTSKAALSRMALGQTLMIYSAKRETSGKFMAWVFKGATDLSRSQVQSGLAWWNLNQAPTESEIALLQNKARAARMGLWSKAVPIAPWDWRKRQERARLLSV